MVKQNDAAPDDPQPVIYASDIDKFLYCERSWWYHFRGFPKSTTSQLETGEKRHREEAQKPRELENARKQKQQAAQRISIFIMIFAVIVIILVLVNMP